VAVHERYRRFLNYSAGRYSIQQAAAGSRTQAAGRIREQADPGRRWQAVARRHVRNAVQNGEVQNGIQVKPASRNPGRTAQV